MLNWILWYINQVTVAFCDSRLHLQNMIQTCLDIAVSVFLVSFPSALFPAGVQSVTHPPPSDVDPEDLWSVPCAILAVHFPYVVPSPEVPSVACWASSPCFLAIRLPVCAVRLQSGLLGDWALAGHSPTAEKIAVSKVNSTDDTKAFLKFSTQENEKSLIFMTKIDN